MKDIIQKQFNDLYANSAEFRIFADRLKEVSTEDIQREYGLNDEAIACYFGHLKMQNKH